MKYQIGKSFIPSITLSLDPLPVRRYTSYFQYFDKDGWDQKVETLTCT